LVFARFAAATAEPEVGHGAQGIAMLAFVDLGRLEQGQREKGQAGHMLGGAFAAWWQPVGLVLILAGGHLLAPERGLRARRLFAGARRFLGVPAPTLDGPRRFPGSLIGWHGDQPRADAARGCCAQRCRF